MKKRTFLAIPVLFAFALSGFFLVTASTNTSGAPALTDTKNDVVFTIPIGENGINYFVEDNPDEMRWGPTAMAISPDGSFWIADTPENQLLHLSGKGELLEKIPTNDYVIGMGDLLVTSNDVWILDIAAYPPKVVQLSLNGKFLKAYDLPEGLHLADGLSGIALGSDGSILVEQGGGYKISRLITPAGDVDQTSLSGYEYVGKNYSASPADLTKEDASKGTILIGDRPIDVEVENDLAGLSILDVTKDDDLYVEVVEMVLDTAFRIDQKVYHYDSSGNLIGMARVPRSEMYTYVEHGIVVGPDGLVYVLIPKQNSAEVQRLTFAEKLTPILVPQEYEANVSQPEPLTFDSETCVSRDSIISTAKIYSTTSFTINSYHINDPYNECSGRIKPIYLSTPGPPPGESYSWNLWDTTGQFSGFMTGGNNGYFAGDRSGVYRACSRGIDCSGLVSRAWNLGSHTGTCDLEPISTNILSISNLQPGDIMNRCSITPRHTIIFSSFLLNGMMGYEATTYNNQDRVVLDFRSFASIADYSPRRYNEACNKTRLPLIRKDETQMQMQPLNPLSTPYPPPPPTPYP